MNLCVSVTAMVRFKVINSKLSVSGAQDIATPTDACALSAQKIHYLSTCALLVELSGCMQLFGKNLRVSKFICMLRTLY